MIIVNTLKDNERIAQLSEKYELEGFSYMITCDGESEKAVTAVKTEGETLFMRLLGAEEEDMADMAIRSALAYGDNRGAQIAVSEDKTFEKSLKRVGFTEKDGVYSIEICKVVHYCG